LQTCFVVPVIVHCSSFFVRLSLLIFFQLIAIASEIPYRLSHGIAAEFFQGAAGEGEGDHGLASYTGRGDYAYVGTLVGGFYGLAGGEIDRLEWAAKGGNWFQIATHANFLAVGDAAFDASGVVAGAGEGGETGS